VELEPGAVPGCTVDLDRPAERLDPVSPPRCPGS